MKKLLFTFLIILPQYAMAVQWTSFGVGTGSQGLGASVQRTHTWDKRSHLQIQYHADRKAAVSGDFQKHFAIIGSTYSALITLYSGAGLTGMSYPEDKRQEYFYFRVPFGVQWESYASHMQVFSEIDLNTGPFPKINMSLDWSLGVRGFL